MMLDALFATAFGCFAVNNPLTPHENGPCIQFHLDKYSFSSQFFESIWMCLLTSPKQRSKSMKWCVVLSVKWESLVPVVKYSSTKKLLQMNDAREKKKTFRFNRNKWKMKIKSYTEETVNSSHGQMKTNFVEASRGDGIPSSGLTKIKEINRKKEKNTSKASIRTSHSRKWNK